MLLRYRIVGRSNVLMKERYEEFKRIVQVQERVMVTVLLGVGTIAGAV